VTTVPVTDGFGLVGAVAVLTGSGRGIGRAIAERFAAAGALVIGLDLAGADVTAAAIRASGGQAESYACDVGDLDQVHTVCKAISESHDGIDVLVNNAALGSHTPPLELTRDHLLRLVDINVGGCFFTAQALFPLLRARGGNIVNISSIGGSSALGRGNLPFSLTKAAVEQMTRDLAIEWATSGIRVNAIAPSQVRTEGFQPLLDEDGDRAGERFLRGIPLGRLAEPADVASAALFLASPAASFISGVVLAVDGGNQALNAGGTIGEPPFAATAG
jgi:NAD(P)-dependent dehydrogenase (short-subunit alcohol dehydrogenase family)